MSINEEKIITHVQTLLGHDKSGHADDHTLRVYKLALHLCETEKANKDIVTLASLLHDCDDYKIFGQEYADNLTNAKKIMSETGIDSDTQEAVCSIIQNMGYSKLLKGIRPQTIEGKIVSDADMLDAIGALGTIRCLSYAIHKCRGPYFDKKNWPDLNLSQEEYKRADRKSDNFINHFFEKLLKLKKLMLTKAGRTAAESRHSFMVLFLRQFFEENNLPEWNAFLDDFLIENDISI